MSEKKKSDQEKRTQLHVVLPQKLQRAVKSKSAAQGESITSVVERKFNEYLEEK